MASLILMLLVVLLLALVGVGGWLRARRPMAWWRVLDLVQGLVTRLR